MSNEYDKFLLENEIIITDNFLDDNELNILLDHLYKKDMKYGHSSGDREIFNNQFFSTHNTESFFNEYILKKIEKHVSKKFKIDRHYMHIQTYGLDGGYHIDNADKNKYTFCIYINDIKKGCNNKEIMENTSGEFFIKIPNKKEIICIDPVNNRGVFFKSDYLHKGMAFNRFYSQFRLCITWKLELIK